MVAVEAQTRAGARLAWWRRVLLSPAPELALLGMLLVGFPLWAASLFSVFGLDRVVVLAEVCGLWGLAAWWVGALRLAAPSSPEAPWLGVRLASGGVWFFVALLLNGAALIQLGVLSLLLRPNPPPFWLTALLTLGGVAALFASARKLDDVSGVYTSEASNASRPRRRRRAAHRRLACLVCGPLLLASIALVGWFFADVPEVLPAYTLSGGTIPGGLAWSPDGRYLAALRADDTLVVWDVATQHEVQSLQCASDASDHSGAVGWSADGAYLAALCGDSALSIWNARTGARVRLSLGGTDGTFAPIALAWSPQGDTLAVLAQGNTSPVVTLYDVKPNRQRASFPVRELAYALAWSPDGQTLAVTQDASIMLLDAAAGQVVRRLPVVDGASVRLAWSPTSDELLVAGPAKPSTQGATVTLWEVTTGQPRFSLASPRGPIPALAWSPDGRAFAVGSVTDTGVTQVYDARTGEARFAWRGQMVISALAWSPDGRSVASAVSDGVIAVWHPVVA